VLAVRSWSEAPSASAAFDGHEDEYLCYVIEPNLAGATAIADLFTAACDYGSAPSSASYRSGVKAYGSPQ
jgi:hypothetical protein